MLPKELAVRHGRRFRNGLRLSKSPHHKTLEDHCFSFQPELAPRKVKDLATLSFVEDKANAALLWPPGIGKTHIGVALAVAACQASYSIYFTSVDDMVRHLKAAEDQGRLISKLTNYLRPSVLMVDECPRSRGSFKIVMHRVVSLRLLLRRCEHAVQRGLRGDRVHPARFNRRRPAQSRVAQSEGRSRELDRQSGIARPALPPPVGEGPGASSSMWCPAHSPPARSGHGHGPSRPQVAGVQTHDGARADRHGWYGAGDLRPVATATAIYAGNNCGPPRSRRTHRAVRVRREHPESRCHAGHRNGGVGDRARAS